MCGVRDAFLNDSGGAVLYGGFLYRLCCSHDVTMPFWVLTWFKRFYQASKIAGSNSGPKEGKTPGAGGFIFVDALNFSALEKKRGAKSPGHFRLSRIKLSVGWKFVPGYLDFGMMDLWNLWRCWPGTWVSNQKSHNIAAFRSETPKEEPITRKAEGSSWH